MSRRSRGFFVPRVKVKRSKERAWRNACSLSCWGVEEWAMWREAEIADDHDDVQWSLEVGLAEIRERRVESG
ncbi:hypothetical protein Csa_008121 [Cucumis sativus]|uniref:Uncharacterized protein n=1 Tax=Cucumis sativus TaxID=3659 RepID=A0A0A0KSX4_CUCSA|nr:hypothetical protein Csa_008121 [Cucumis sativus]